eukprot:jgi/Bigna1/68867/fgenesh1_pg.7_\
MPASVPINSHLNGTINRHACQFQGMRLIFCVPHQQGDSSDVRNDAPKTDVKTEIDDHGSGKKPKEFGDIEDVSDELLRSREPIMDPETGPPPPPAGIPPPPAGISPSSTGGQSTNKAQDTKEESSNPPPACKFRDADGLFWSQSIVNGRLTKDAVSESDEGEGEVTFMEMDAEGNGEVLMTDDITEHAVPLKKARKIVPKLRALANCTGGVTKFTVCTDEFPGLLCSKFGAQCTNLSLEIGEECA